MFFHSPSHDDMETDVSLLYFFFGHTILTQFFLCPGLHCRKWLVFACRRNPICFLLNAHRLGPIGATFAKKLVDAGYRVIMAEIGAAYVLYDSRMLRMSLTKYLATRSLLSPVSILPRPRVILMSIP